MIHGKFNEKYMKYKIKIDDLEKAIKSNWANFIKPYN